MSIEFEEEKMSVYEYDLSRKKRSKMFDFFMKIGIAKTEAQSKMVALAVFVVCMVAAIWIAFGNPFASIFRVSEPISRDEMVGIMLQNIKDDPSLSESEKETRIRFQERRLQASN